MADPTFEPQVIRFADFELDLGSGELRKSGGDPVLLAEQPFRILATLIRQSGNLVTRDELRRQLWPDDTFVDFEHSLNAAIKRLRAALGDSAADPRFIQTIPRRGYRFIGPSETISSTSPVEPLVAVVGSTARRRNHGKTAITLSFALITAAAVIASVVYFGSGREGAGSRAESSGKLTISYLSRGRRIEAAGISPNGKYVAYSVADGLKRSGLWIRHVPTMSSTQIIPDADVVYHDLSFSPHADYIYYVLKSNQHQLASLYRIPVTGGGTSKKLLDDVDSRVSFSPDGTRMVFRRRQLARRENTLVIANADGTGSQQIASIKEPESFGRPAWSPDGNVIASTAGHTDGGSNEYLVEITVKDGILRKISERKWFRARDVTWDADGSALFMLAAEHEDATPLQVWRLSYPSGEPRPITDAHKGFNKLSVSAASRTMLLNESALVTSVWLVPFEDPSRARQITPVGGYGGGLSWTRDGKIVHQSLAHGILNLSVMDADGSNQRPLLLDMPPRGHAIQPSLSSDGRYILFAADFTGIRHIWRVDSDGRNPVQLTHGKGEDYPTSSPDGRWVFYTDISYDRPTVWRVPIVGGAPIQVTRVFSQAAHVSPDGNLMASYTSDERPGSFWQIGIFDLARGESVKIFPNPMRHRAPIRWTPDGRALTYADTKKGFVNIWVQPLSGGEPKQLTNFSGDEIFAFGWSRDGKYLACVRGTWTADLALITNFE